MVRPQGRSGRSKTQLLQPSGWSGRKDMASTQESNASTEKQQGVRFEPQDEEVAPDQRSLNAVETVTGLKGQRDDLNPQAEQELQQLRTTLKNNIQSSRMQHHAFEPVSLPGSQPASRVSRARAVDVLQITDTRS